MSDTNETSSQEPWPQGIRRRPDSLDQLSPAGERLAEAMRRNLNEVHAEALKRQEEAKEARRREDER